MTTKRQKKKSKAKSRRQQRMKALQRCSENNLMISISKDRPVLEVRISDSVAKKMIDLVEGDRKHECGGLLIGTLCVDRITGNKVVFVTDMYTDGEYGGSAEYTFTPEVQTKALCYIREKYGRMARVVGTMHSHGQFPAFFSQVDDRMMRSLGGDLIHMVISPSSSKFVLTLYDREGTYHHDVFLNMGNIRGIFNYERRNPGV